MPIIVLDLEWNGAFCSKVNGYFNEIIEIGAVRLSDTLEIEDCFDAVIRPRVSRKLSHWVTDLTGYTDEQLKSGTTFVDAMDALHRFVGDKGATLLTWSNTDLLVFMENCRYYYDNDRIPFISHYLDLQSYAQQRQGLGTAQQVALVKFAELLGMNSDDLELHHAIDDSRLSTQILQRVYDKRSFKSAVQPLNEQFYRRITFKPSFVKDLDDPAVRRKDFQFRCTSCGKRLKAKGNWKFFHRHFQASLACPSCDAEYVGRVQIRQLFDGPQVKRRLLPKTEKQPEESQTT